MITIGIMLLLYRVRTILTPFLLAAVVAYVAFPFIQIFERKEVPRPVAILLVYLIFAVAVSIIISFLIPQLIRELDDILRVLPRQTQRMEGLGLDYLRSLQHLRVPEILREGTDLILRRVQGMLEGFATRLAELLVSLVTHVFALAISPILAFYMLRDLSALKRRFFLYIPRMYRRDLYYLLAEANKVLNGFIRGQLFISVVVGLLIAFGLSLVGIRYALFVGLLAGLFDLIPYFGPLVGIIPALVLALMKAPITVLWVILVFVAVNQLEASVIAPKIIGERVGLHPLAVIFAVLAGGELMGLVGMLLAVPVAGIVRVLLLYMVSKVDKSPT